MFSQGVSHLFDFTLTKTKQSKTKMQTKKQNKTVGNKQHLSYNFIALLTPQLHVSVTNYYHSTATYRLAQDKETV